MNKKTCFFIGSRDTPNSIRERLTEAVEKHIIEYGVTTFTVGHYGSFDNLVADILKKTKKKYGNIELNLLAPYALDQKIEVPELFNGILYPNGLELVPKRYAIAQANRYMIQHSDYLIAYTGFGYSRNFIEYAQRQEKKGRIKVTLL